MCTLSFNNYTADSVRLNISHLNYMQKNVTFSLEFSDTELALQILKIYKRVGWFVLINTERPFIVLHIYLLRIDIHLKFG